MNKRTSIFFVIGILGSVLFYAFFGFYTIQPIGAIPDGITLLVMRKQSEPFFNSPDATALRVSGGVSILTRLAALSSLPSDRIILRLPYFESAYLASTSGHTYESRKSE